MQNRISRIALTSLFGLFATFIYAPMIIVFLLSFQGREGGLTLPLRGLSMHWFTALISQERVGDTAGAFERSLCLALLVATITVLISFSAGLAFRRHFFGATTLFSLSVSSLIMPGLLVGLGTALVFQLLQWPTNWYSSAVGAQLSWTLPFGLLIMFAVLGRQNKSLEEAASDLGATGWQRLVYVDVPVALPGIIGVGLFGFTLSYDEFARTVIVVGPNNTLPLEIWAMTTNVTSPSLYAIGTLTTATSLVVIGLAVAVIGLLERRRASKAI